MEGYCQRSIATPTGRSYGSAQDRYKKFCKAAGCRPLPTSERLLCRFLTYVAEDGVGFSFYVAEDGVGFSSYVEEDGVGFSSYVEEDGVGFSSFKCYLAAIRHWQVAEGHGDPGIGQMPKLEQLMKGIRRAQASGTRGTEKPKLPITPLLLRKMRRVWQSDSVEPSNDMLWAAC